MFPKGRKTGAQNTESPLEARKRAIAEQEEKNRAQMEQCNKVLEEAPRLAEEKARARRAEIRTRATHTEARRGNPVALPDKWRLEVNAAAPARDKRLRRERQQGRLLFFVLLFIVLLLGYSLYYAITHA